MVPFGADCYRHVLDVPVMATLSSWLSALPMGEIPTNLWRFPTGTLVQIQVLTRSCKELCSPLPTYWGQDSSRPRFLIPWPLGQLVVRRHSSFLPPAASSGLTFAPGFASFFATAGSVIGLGLQRVVTWFVLLQLENSL